MPPTLIAVAVGVLIGVALLGPAVDRRSLATVALAAALPDLDVLLSLGFRGSTNAVLHTAFIPAVAAALVYYDTTHRETSWLRTHYGWYGIRVAWVALFAHTFAHIGLDWAHLDGINIFWPLVDQFVTLDGELYYTPTEGLVQTFVDVSVDPETGQQAVDAGQDGTTQTVHVSTPAQPTKEPTGPVDRRFPIVVNGWQLYVLVTGVFALVARRLQTPLSRDE